MTSKEKAKELVNMFAPHCGGETGSDIELYNAKRCASKCVREMQKIYKTIYNSKVYYEELEEVKQEIEKL